MDNHSARTPGQDRSVRHNLGSRGGVCDARSGRRDALPSAEERPQPGLLDAVDRHPLAVDLDHRDPRPVGTLELRPPADVDLGDLEPELAAEALELVTGELAEVA